MKILFVMPRFHTNQIPIFKGLKDKGHSVFCMVAYCGKTENYDILTPMQMKESVLTKLYHAFLLSKYRHKQSVVESKHGSKFIPSIFALLWEIKKILPDIVILRERSIASGVVYLVCRILGIRQVVIYNQSPLNRLKKTNGLRYRLKRKIYPKVTYTPVKYSEYPIDFEQKMYSEENTYFVPFVANISSINHSEYCKSNIVHFLDVGKYRDYKNHYVLVDAVKILVESEEKDFNVTIVGQVSNEDEMIYYKNLKNYILQRGVEKYISLFMNVPFGEMSDVYSKHDVFILTSKKELASISVLEAMANGISVITTSANGTASYVIPGVTGAIFETCNARSLADKMREYLSDYELAEERGLKAFEQARTDYNFENYYDSFCSMIRKEFEVEVK